jgi:hypothetical protein
MLNKRRLRRSSRKIGSGVDTRVPGDRIFLTRKKSARIIEKVMQLLPSVQIIGDIGVQRGKGMHCDCIETGPANHQIPDHHDTNS